MPSDKVEMRGLAPAELAQALDAIAHTWGMDRNTLNIKVLEWATLAGMDGAASKVRAVLVWWLDHQCPRCNGTKYEVVPGTNRQSSRTCRPSPQGCGGSGERQLPHGRDGRLIEAHMIDCLHRARQKIRRFTSSAHVA